MCITQMGPNDPRNSGIPNPRNFSSLAARGKEGAGTSHFDKNERGGERREGMLHFPFQNSTGNPRSGVQRKGNSLLWSRARGATPAGGGRRSFRGQSAGVLRPRKKGNNKVPECQTLLGGPTGSGTLHGQVKHACPRGLQIAVHTAPLRLTSKGPWEVGGGPPPRGTPLSPMREHLLGPAPENATVLGETKVGGGQSDPPPEAPIFARQPNPRILVGSGGTKPQMGRG